MTMLFLLFADKKLAGKSKDEQMQERKQELEKRLLHVNDQIGSANKKSAKRGTRKLLSSHINRLGFIRNVYCRRNE